MTGGDVAALIAAIGFIALVLFLAVPILKLGRVLDEARNAIRDLNQSTSPLISELTETVTQTNKQLQKIDVITDNAAQVSTNVSSLVAVITSAVGSPLAKLVGFSAVAKDLLLGKKK